MGWCRHTLYLLTRLCLPSELKPTLTKLRPLFSVTHNQYTNKRQTTVSSGTKADGAHSPHTSAVVQASHLNVINGVRHCSQDRDTMNNPAGLFLSPFTRLPPPPPSFHFPFTHTYTHARTLFFVCVSTRSISLSLHPSLLFYHHLVLCAHCRSRSAGLTFTGDSATVKWTSPNKGRYERERE